MEILSGVVLQLIIDAFRPEPAFRENHVPLHISAARSKPT